MKTIQLFNDDKIDRTVEVTESDFPGEFHRMRLLAELKTRDSATQWRAVEYKEPEPVIPPTAEELYEIEVAEKEREILRNLAVTELEAERTK